MPWERPSPRVAELIRTAAEQMLATANTVYAEVDAVSMANSEGSILHDPAIVAAIRRSTYANLSHWAQANLVAPGEPVAPNLGPEVLGIARDLVRRGLDQSWLDAYRAGQNVAWRLWMAQAFTLTDDARELSELLDVTAQSIFGFVDDTLAGIAEEVNRERDRLTSGTHAERLAVVTLLLEGAPIALERASTRLQYALDRRHTAAIVFSDGAQPDERALEQAAEALARSAGARRPLTVVASASSLWVWIPGAEGPDPAALRTLLADVPEARIALGPTGSGVDGFRRSHLDALATQRLLQRMPAAVRIATFDEVEVVALAAHDERRAAEFVDRTLGPLATAPTEVRETLRVYLREGSNAKATAGAMYLHRNTVLARLAKAEALLPAPLDGRLLPVALALEVVRWIGPR
jgi:DNA-binding PucR family transcriptional regulator